MPRSPTSSTSALAATSLARRSRAVWLTAVRDPSSSCVAPTLLRERQTLSRRLFLYGVAGTLAGAAAGAVRADTIRQLTLVRPDTNEVARDVPFWWAGAPYEQGLAELDWLMRDVQAEEVHPIDLRVYYLLAMVQGQFGGRPILITSGYRTEATNERLRRHGIDAARNSFHLRGRAVDIQVPGVEPRSMARLGLLLGLGGVGVYSTFVHLDTGQPRMWQG
jgi:uncharacterized protein YcbK (DUF882 family)